MRLWHEKLISKLPQKQLCGQWRECIALLGNGWCKKHSTVDYVFKHPESYLIVYSGKIYEEMKKRGYKPDGTKIADALNKRHDKAEVLGILLVSSLQNNLYRNKIIYPEHNEQYYQECIENLREKGIEI